MTPVEDMRFCPWEGETLPADHDCIGAGEEATPTHDTNGDPE